MLMLMGKIFNFFLIDKKRYLAAIKFNGREDEGCEIKISKQWIWLKIPDCVLLIVLSASA